MLCHKTLWFKDAKSMLSILNKFVLQKELQSFVTNNVFWTKKNKNTTTTKQKSQT